jgi:hypothetical protein
MSNYTRFRFVSTLCSTTSFTFISAILQEFYTLPYTGLYMLPTVSSNSVWGKVEKIILYIKL